MKTTIRYRFLWLLLAFAATGISSCRIGKQKKLNRFISLWRKDKIPYGTYYAYENLAYIFPEADITINRASPAKYPEFDAANYSSDSTSSKHKKAYIIISPQVLPNPSEINALMNFVGEGNTVFISSFRIGDSLLRFLKLKMQVDNPLFFPRDTLKVKVNSPITNDTFAFEYPGDSYGNYISSLDSQYTTVLGTDENGRPDFVKFNYKSGGALYLHFAPMAFTNFFLLHKNNKAYYDNVFSYLPKSVTEVKWDEYFRYSRDFSVLRFLLSIPAFSWAFWLLLLLFLIIYVFESKRRQRVIPAVNALRNSSLDFVKTIGRLYYQRKDNLNLAHKMAAHFLGHVRTKYNLATASLDSEFAEKLSYKSGYDKVLVKDIVDQIKVMQQQQSLSDGGLLELNKKIEAFYKNT